MSKELIGALELNRIHNICCLKAMALLPDNSVDMVICDLPYQVTKNHWDSLIDLDELWMHYKRIVKDNGAIVLFGQDKFTARLMMSNEKWHRYNLIWQKDRPSGFLNASRMPLRSHEDILVFYKKLPTYNPQFWEGKPLHGMGSKFKEGKSGNNNYGDFDSHKNPSANRVGDTKKYPRSVLTFPRPHPPIHPTQKPIELCEWLIKTYTDEDTGAVVLDNCAGSGTTCIAASRTNRNFIGFELNEDYFLLAKDRLEKETAEEVVGN